MITFMPWSPILILNLRSATRRWDFLQVICISFNFISAAVFHVCQCCGLDGTGRFNVQPHLNFSGKNYCNFGGSEQDGERTTAYRNSVETEAEFHNGYQA